MEQHLHVKRDIAGFVVPLGATLNMDGTALYEAVAALFIANLAGIELNLMQQMIVFITAMLAAMGAPGIPSAGMVTMVWYYNQLVCLRKPLPSYCPSIACWTHSALWSMSKGTWWEAWWSRNWCEAITASPRRLG